MSKIKSNYLYFLSLRIFFGLFINSIVYPQSDEFQFEFFTVKLESNRLIVNSNSNEIFSKVFENPFVYLSDLDQDGNNELLVKDVINTNGNNEYLLYIFNTLDTFFISREITSGLKEPYEIVSGEIDGLIIISGNPDFNIYNKEIEFIFLPINCWKFEEGEVYLINDLLYDPFIEENNSISVFLDKIFMDEGKDCSTSVKVRAAIASGYMNYLNAGELAVASNFLKTYYLCNDTTEFNYELDNFFNKEY